MAMSSHIAVKVQNYAVARCTTMTEMDTGCKNITDCLTILRC